MGSKSSSVQINPQYPYHACVGNGLPTDVTRLNMSNNIPEFWSNDDDVRVPKELLEEMEAEEWKEEDRDNFFFFFPSNSLSNKRYN